MEELKYVIEDSTIAELLGVQNFSSDESAILELVKNAYDAKALSLLIKFENGNLYIFDDGDGMNADDIKRHWMHIGKSDKGYEIVDENNHTRVQAGSMGIGRFALSRLGKSIIMITKKDNEDGVKWTTDWNGSVIDKCCTDFRKGTRISIIGLRERWTEKRIQKLQDYLERTYNDDAMQISIVSGNEKMKVYKHFPDAEVGKNCRSCIKLHYDQGNLSVEVTQDEFMDSAKEICKGIDLKKHTANVNMKAELKGTELEELLGTELEQKLIDVGAFDATMFFNLVASKDDKERLLYKYTKTNNTVESGIILYRNAFSISSFEGKKDWLGLGKRARKSPAAASHPTGTWRVRDNQIAGYVQIDKKTNKALQDLSNRQGIDENSYYQLFVEIIIAGISEFERYRQSIVRKIAEKTPSVVQNTTPVSDRVIKNPLSIKDLSDNEAKQLIQEIELYKEEGKQNRKDKEEFEARYRYDVQILNVLATTGLKASSIAHEMKNDRNDLLEMYDSVVNALKHYDMWDELNLEENKEVVCYDVPYLLSRNNEVSQKLVVFMNTMLSEIEKQQFEAKEQSILDVMSKIKKTWERDYGSLKINLNIAENLEYYISEDKIRVIFDNLILNTVQQNDELPTIHVGISARTIDGLLCFEYKDDGKGLDEKYKDNPRKILEVHETTRTKGHGLGMWIVNSTSDLSGGKILDIQGTDGFYIEFTVGGKNSNG